MTTNVPPVFPPARQYTEQESHYIRKTVTFANGSFVMPASVPAGALITSTLILIEQAFSAGASLTLGTTVGGSDLVAAADSACTAAGSKRPETATLTGRRAADTPIYGTIAGAPTAGVATIVMHFAPNNDG